MPAAVRVLGAVRVTARFRAPAEDGGLLAVPPLAEIGAQVEANTARLNAAAVRIGGLTLSEFRGFASLDTTLAVTRYFGESRESIPAFGRQFLIAGHQPEFFHPGVWIKNFALNGLAKRLGRIPLNLVVDNDTVKHTALRVPKMSDDPEDVIGENVPFDLPEGELTYEDYRVRDRKLFDSFPERLAKVAKGWKFEPLAVSAWPSIRTELDRGATLGEAISRTRRELERKWGVHNCELPVSRLAGTPSFAVFVHSILSDLPRFVDCYNAAIRDYRTRNHLRSKNHPAPKLVRRGDSLEAPFWAWALGSPKRERLFFRQETGEVFAGYGSLGRLPREPFAAATNWEVRPRALTLTLFVRLCLADGFIHGIGGGTYDQVTDDIIRRYYGIEPPSYAVVSATVWLPLNRFPANAASLHETERRARDLDWNPQRWTQTRERFASLVEQKAKLMAAEPTGRAERREWFRRLQAVTREMRPAVALEREETESTLKRLGSEMQANAILASREYAWPLFPESLLRNLFAQLG
jgi:hypothetical protein